MYALEGVKIVDLTSYIAGSYCGMMLADFGADVIKVENRQGDPFRDNRGFLGWNRGKRGIVLDLKEPEGREVLHTLVKQSDVVVENYRPGVAERLGVGYDDLKQVNPKIVYCSISAWGQTGPYAGKPGFDPLMQALGGVMAWQGGSGPPVYLQVAVADYTAAFLGVQGVLAALYVREKTGIAQRVDTNLLNAVIAIQTSDFVRTADPAKKPTGRSIPYQLFQTADHWMFVACGNNNFWLKLCQALDIEEFASDPRFTTVPQRTENREELLGILQEILLTKETAEWIRILEEHDVPCAPVKTREELFDDPQVLHNGMVVEHDHPERGRLWQMGLPIKFSETPGRAIRPAPLLGQHTIEVLGELGYSADQIESLAKKKTI